MTELSADAATVEFHDDADVNALVEAASDLVEHVARMLDGWAEMGPGEQRNRELWAPLHMKADALRDLIPGQESR